jgi:hypothetical protein
VKNGTTFVMKPKKAPENALSHVCAAAEAKKSGSPRLPLQPLYENTPELPKNYHQIATSLPESIPI